MLHAALEKKDTYFIHLNPIYTDFKKVNKSTSQQVNEQYGMEV